MNPDAAEATQINKEYDDFKTDVEYLAKDLFKSWTDEHNSPEQLTRYANKSIEAAKIFFTTMNEIMPPIRDLE